MKLTIEIDLSHPTFNDVGYLNTDELRKVIEKVPSALAGLPLNRLNDKNGLITHKDGKTVCEWAVL